VRWQTEDEGKRLQANRWNISHFTPKEWNNIPIPLTDFCYEFIVFNKMQMAHNSLVDREITELLTLTAVLPTYFEQYLEMLPIKIIDKIGLVHSRLDYDIKASLLEA
jgi:hypothetical protein